MAGGTVKTWDQIWEIGKAAKCTHWNYSRGKNRFRGILEEPEEIGEEPAGLVNEDEKIRVRFYTLINDEYVENEDLDTWIKPPKSTNLDVPDNFDDLPSDDQRTFIQVQMERISAGRFSRQMASHDRLQERFIEFLAKQIEKKDRLIAELYEKYNELVQSRGIANIWEFLVHPNAQTAIQTLAAALASGKGISPELLRGEGTAPASLPPTSGDKKS